MIPPSVSFTIYLPTRGRGSKPERVEDVMRSRRGRDEMSRAFVKEPDEGAPDEGLPERQISDHPNYVTPAGLRQLEQKLGEQLEAPLLQLAELLLELPQAGGGHVVGVVADLPLGEALIGRPFIGLLDECSAHLVTSASGSHRVFDALRFSPPAPHG